MQLLMTCLLRAQAIPALTMYKKSMSSLAFILSATALLSLVLPAHASSLSLSCEMVTEESKYARPNKTLINLNLHSGTGSYHVVKTTKTKRLDVGIQGSLITMKEKSLLGVDRTDGSTMVFNRSNRKIVRNITLLGVPVKQKEVGICVEQSVSVNKTS
jgi:hypothetical protein